ncbi:MAG: response regulator transcription factor [Kaiparowitsia implicata GSE-PSE-MK54-09C]|jgi:OmpR-family two-component system manganese-sensing response regulator|nr:response regulator transcription factor [Kaiparowitsia implicata GSE-PSE-MK54-09C]
MRILLVDDEVELTDPLSLVLQREGYQVDVAHTGQEGSTLAQQGGYELLILDWMLPYQSGLDICRHIRQRGDRTPVLFLTAKDTVNDRVEGLDAGADDYIVKPFELRELLARVRALLRRPPTLEPSSASVRLSVADLMLDIENQLAFRGDRTLDLSEKETQLLAYFMRHPNQLLSHDQIYQQVWCDGEKPSSNALAAQIRLLRRKVDPPQTTALIHTVYGKGYRFGPSSEPFGSS